ncbi:class II fructose-bisphosphate aldolase [Bacillaceae bacterium Marseille-Q3522]|nr:class II fructose-bisphosphate aldolase [Bacillaceae bacterium Marseille-Q3522]
MLVSSKELLQTARDKKFAVPSANFFDQDSIKTYTEVATKKNLPIILSIAESHFQYLSLDEAVVLGKFYGSNTDTPVVLHLDHGVTLDVIKKAVDIGFTSVMIDASQEPFGVNVKKTEEVVRYAHEKGVVVEAEIGHVGTGSLYEKNNDDSIYTTVEEAKEFVDQTNVDSLAISIGTAHGAYTGKPKINFQRLNDIAKSIATPLVLHGGSSSGDHNLEKCALGGITKINIFTDFTVSALNSVRHGNPENYFEMKELARKGMRECLENYYKVFHTEKFHS